MKRRYARVPKYAPREIDTAYPGLRLKRALVVEVINDPYYLGTILGLRWGKKTAWIYEKHTVGA